MDREKYVFPNDRVKERLAEALSRRVESTMRYARFLRLFAYSEIMMRVSRTNVCQNVECKSNKIFAFAKRNEVIRHAD